MTGSDTTSVFFNKGKTKAYHMNKQYIEDLRIKEKQKHFTEVNVQKQQIASAGERFVINLYGGRKNKTIDNVRHDIYNRTIQKSRLSTTFKLESLPPTSAALMHHSSRAYHAVQQALGNTLPAEEWGWTRKKGFLWPVMTDKEIAPESLLKLISCGCKTNCRKVSLCTCRRYDIECSSLCSGCNGLTCENNGIIADISE